MYNFIELSDLIGFGYDLRRMGFIFCGKHPFLLTRIQVSDPYPLGFCHQTYFTEVREGVQLIL